MTNNKGEKMTEVHVVENDGSIHGMFSSYDLALDYAHRTKPYRGQWRILKYVVDRLVPQGPRYQITRHTQSVGHTE